MKKIITRREEILPSGTVFDVALHPLLRRIYAARGVKSSVELERGLAQLLPWWHLKGIQQASTVLAAALKTDKKILVVGDFDADGATGTAVAVRALKSLGAQQVSYL